MKWTEKDFDISVEMVKKGKSYEDISKVLNRSVSSVRNKLIKNGYSRDQFLISECEGVCLNCNEKFEYKKTKRGRKFCSKSCSAIFNNKLRVDNGVNEKIKSKISNSLKKVRDGKESKCLNCGDKLNLSRKKYCDSFCFQEHRWNMTIQKIERGIDYVDYRQVKRYLIEKTGEKCDICGWSEVNEVTGKVPIELDHIDGDSTNNRLDNVRLLCPNHHSLTPTYKYLNKGKGRGKRMKRYYDSKTY